MLGFKFKCFPVPLTAPPETQYLHFLLEPVPQISAQLDGDETNLEHPPPECQNFNKHAQLLYLDPQNRLEILGHYSTYLFVGFRHAPWL